MEESIQTINATAKSLEAQQMNRCQHPNMVELWPAAGHPSSVEQAVLLKIQYPWHTHTVLQMYLLQLHATF